MSVTAVQAQNLYVDLLRQQTALASMGPIQDLFFASNGPDGRRPRAWTEDWAWSWGFRRADFRTILWNEVVRDYDSKDWRTNVRRCAVDQMALRSWRAPYYVWPTGGKGIHLSVFLDAGGYQKQCDWELIRAAIYERLTEATGVETDPCTVYWRDDSMGHLLRMEGGLRWIPATLDHWDERDQEGMIPSYKFWCASLPWERPVTTRSYSVNYPPLLKVFRIPQEWLPTPEQVNAQRRFEGEAPRGVTTGEVPPEIQTLVRALRSGRRRLPHIGNFAVGTYLVRSGLPDENIHEVFASFPGYDPRVTQGQIDSIRTGSGSGKPYHCPSIETVRKRCASVIQEFTC